MQILFTPKTNKSIGTYLKSIVNRRVSTHQVGDYLDISSFNKLEDPELYVCDSFIEALRQIRRYRKAFGVNWFDITRGGCYHRSEVFPGGVLNDPIYSVKRIASVNLKTRSKKNINAVIDKIDMGSTNTCHEYYYVLKHNDRQIANLCAVVKPDKQVDIAYLTNVLGRKKYRCTEQILVQTLVEDCIKNGYVPRLTACAMNVGSFMGRGYNNLALYKKMGMHVYDPSYPDLVAIDAIDVIPILKKYLAHNGEILEGTKNRLDALLG